ncbi:MAG TPA: M56 family metallopeptidase [Longimicrobium sp.]|nr:M56 family metallopeptidase [Longimicrobium sp.]
MDISALLLLVAKVTLLLGGATCAIGALRRASAAARHAVWTTALAAALALPAAGLLLPAARIEAQGRLWTAAAAWLDGLRAPAAPVSPVRTVVDVHGIAPVLDGGGEGAEMPARGPIPAGTLLFAVWALGAAACLARIGFGVVAANRMARGARPAESDVLARVAGELADAGLAPRSARLRVSAEVSAPAAVGIFRPAVLLPSDAVCWDTAEARAVLAHELGHVARRDCLTQLVASVATAVYWFHPLAWYASRRMCVERERACDDRALLAGAPPSRYATLLVHVLRASRQSVLPAGVLAMAAPREMEARIRSILDPAVRRRPLSLRARLATPAAVAAAASLIAAIQVDAAPASSAFASRGSVWADAARREPDTRGDSMALPSSERIPLPASVLDDAARKGQAALAGPDAALAQTLLNGLRRVPAWSGDLVRERSAWALSRAEGTRLAEPLLAALASADWREQAYAAWALAQSREPRAVAPLVELMRRPEWRLRAMAAYALAEIGGPPVSDAMTRAADDEAWQVRVSAVAYLGRLGGAANLALVRAHLADRHIAVRLAAEKALSE